MFGLIKKLTVAQRIFLIIAIAIIVASVQAVIGLYVIGKDRDSLKMVYEQRMLPLQKLNEIDANMLKNRLHLSNALTHVRVEVADDATRLVMDANFATEEAEYIENKIQEISNIWKSYTANDASAEAKALMDKFAASRGEFVKQALKPGIAQLRANNYEALLEVNKNAQALYMAAYKDLESLKAVEFSAAKAAYEEASALYEVIRLLTFAGLSFAILLLAWLGFAISRSITKALGGEPDEMYNTAKRIAAGDLDFNVTLAANDHSSAMAAMSNMQSNIKLLVSDADMLAKAALEGRLGERADVGRHQGDYRRVVSGVNDTLNSVIRPLNTAANYVERISKGDIPEKITAYYSGDFNTLKNNLNTCIDAINNLVAETVDLEKSAIEGRLDARANVGRYQGDFRKVVEGMNNCLDAVIHPLNMAAGHLDHLAKGNIPEKITDHYNGDFNVIKNNLNACIDALTLLVADANMLSAAAQEGRMDVRADTSKHWGDYRKVVEGVNGTLDSVMQNTAAEAETKAAESQVLADAVAETQAIIEAAKVGDLTSRVPLDGKTGAIASLCDGVNALMDKMTEVIIQVREAGETINTAAGEISSGNNDLSNRTEQQASSLEETAASMEQLAATVKNNAENAKQANQLAAAASGVAVRGGEVVGQVVGTMAAINQSARQIEDIISVIDGIAFQTNILALNAAVEAARAGEQGRGFAVVAGEVRNLAQRSASAAKEIKELITDSVNKTAEGTKQVQNAGQTMQEIVTSVQRVTDIMGEITAASVEQSSGISQVNTAITSMDEVTQQNAALVEEAAAAAESLVDQAMSLMENVSAFRLSGASSLQHKPNLRVVASPAQIAGKSAARPSATPKLVSNFSFEDAKQAHVKWKNRLIDYIAGRSNEHLDVEKVCRDDQCPLGHWIYGPAHKHAHTAEYKELKTAHAEFHQSVGHIVRCVHDQDQAQARQLLGGEFSKSSRRTLNAIDQIEAREKNRSTGVTKPTSKTVDDNDWEEF